MGEMTDSGQLTFPLPAGQRYANTIYQPPLAAIASWYRHPS